MASEYDFSELRNYLRGQMDLGEAEIFLDEPWTLQKRSAKAMQSPASPAVKKPAAVSKPAVAAQLAVQKPAAVSSSAIAAQPAAQFSPAMQSPAQDPAPIFAGFDAPAPRPARQTAPAAYESAASLDDFYTKLSAETLYAQAGSLARYEGPANPRLLLLFAAPSADLPAGSTSPANATNANPFFASPVGQMLTRLFASLGIPAESIGVTFFYKGATPRNIPPLLEAALRKMLTKELSFIAPQVMVTFGEPVFHQLFGKGQNFNALAGTDLDFAGVKTCSLVDAVAMSADKQLKLLTWKVHIPKSSYFTVAK